LNDTDIKYIENYSKVAAFSPGELPFKIQEGMGDTNIKKYAAFYTGVEASGAFTTAIDKAFEAEKR
jgi:hypothetical protein